MKNVQIIDGAANSLFEVYEVSDELFKLMFPDANDIAFLDDVEQTFRKTGNDQTWDQVYKNKADKKRILGVHGTLHLTGSYCKKEYFPARKEAEVLTFSMRHNKD